MRNSLRPLRNRLARFVIAGCSTLILTSGLVQSAAAEHFVISPGGENEVRFTSKAPLESFDGKTHKVSGFIDADPAALPDSIVVQVEVDLASLDTGIEMRNKHMREEHLETDKYPKAVFRGAKLLPPSPAALTAGQKLSFVCQGTFDLHGVVRPLQIPVVIEPAVEDGKTILRVTTQFDVTLSDYKISRPQFLVMRLDEKQHVSVKLVARQTI